MTARRQVLMSKLQGDIGRAELQLMHSSLVRQWLGASFTSPIRIWPSCAKERDRCAREMSGMNMAPNGDSRGWI